MKTCSVIAIIFAIVKTSIATDSQLEKRAHQGDAEAQYDLSTQIIWTEGGNIAEAKKWCKKSAENGSGMLNWNTAMT